MSNTISRIFHKSTGLSNISERKERRIARKTTRDIRAIKQARKVKGAPNFDAKGNPQKDIINAKNAGITAKRRITRRLKRIYK